MPEQLAQADRAAALTLVQAVAEADGIAALSEDGRLALAHGRPGSVHLLWRGPDGTDSVAGYLYLSPADEARDRTAELCVAPNRRGGGIGRALSRTRSRRPPGRYGSGPTAVCHTRSASPRASASPRSGTCG